MVIATPIAQLKGDGRYSDIALLFVPCCNDELNRNHYERFEPSPGPKLMFTLHPSFALSHDLNA
ncbi:hypothetical protein MPC4_170123 [Methylocella tundrae]|uniref:Uncharacterized protein n=1 Tax=Methylocella tundrae TaxID=227605 RepID=A0A8B6M672_METTU|nr:hypothetical protein MPC1_270008 [Methylocella tundrae]VTZ49592.1 hypothetical protein MPC4_170123 [Methylocella tundrae]